jgi:hypothetical protein
VSERVFELFDEYAAAYARGERPKAEEYLDRAGADRAQLSALLGEFVRRSPVHTPSDDDLRLLGLILAEEPPLLTLRVDRGMRIDDVVDALIDQLGLEPAKRTKLKRYYQRLEGGLLDPHGLSMRLRGVLSNLLGASADAALSWRVPPPAAASAFLRQGDRVEAVSGAAPPAADTEDEIDRLFTGGA